MPKKRAQGSGLSTRSQAGKTTPAGQRGARRRASPSGPGAQSELARPRRFLLGPALAAGMSGNEEAPELGLRTLLHDPKVRDLGLRLWRQFSGMEKDSERDLGEAGLSFADLWKPGVTEQVTTSSTAEEIARYRKTLTYRAKFLEAVLEETLADLERIDQMKPAANELAALPEPPAPRVNSDQSRGGSQA